MKIFKPVLALAALLFFVADVRATVVVPVPFTDHMVLQRKMPVPVWGTADAGEQVTVAFNGQTKKTATGTDGKWRVVLNPMKEAGPLVMTITGTNAITISDVYVGE